MHADSANYVPWSGVENKKIASTTELGLVKVGSNLTIDADGKLNATGGGGSGGHGGPVSSDVTWTANNIMQPGFGDLLREVPISAGSVVNFVKLNCGNDTMSGAMISPDGVSRQDVTLDFNRYYLQNPVPGYLQVVDSRNVQSQADRLSVHFSLSGGGSSEVQVNGPV